MGSIRFSYRCYGMVISMESLGPPRRVPHGTNKESYKAVFKLTSLGLRRRCGGQGLAFTCVYAFGV